MQESNKFFVQGKCYSYQIFVQEWRKLVGRIAQNDVQEFVSWSGRPPVEKSICGSASKTTCEKIWPIIEQESRVSVLIGEWIQEEGAEFETDSQSASVLQKQVNQLEACSWSLRSLWNSLNKESVFVILCRLQEELYMAREEMQTFLKYLHSDEPFVP